MQTVSNAFTAEERDSIRSIAHNLQISWKKQSTLGNRTFTIAISTIGGNDVIGINPGAIGSPANYKYFDESSYVTGLGWERGLNLPTGGLSKAMAEATLDNTSERFTPRYMGGRSELFTSIQPGRPAIINAGFEVGGADYTIPEFVGRIIKQPAVDRFNGGVSLSMEDYVGYFESKYLDRTAMFTSLRSDQIMSNLLQTDLGMSTAQYDLDTGINVIPFGLFETGTKMSDIFNQLAQAENGYFYQDESGIFKFYNRQHWDSPNNAVQRVIYTSQVLGMSVPSDDNIINVVEVRSTPRAKQPNQIVYKLGGAIQITANTDTEVFVDFDDPMLAIDDPIVTGNTSEDGTGASVTVTLVSSYKFAKSAKYIFRSTVSAFITDMTIYGRPAKVQQQIYYRNKDGSSVTAFDDRPLTIENDYIQSQFWAESFANVILNDYSTPEKIMTLTIRAIPELQLGDFISWQGRYWQIADIKSNVNPSVGYTQELKILQRSIVSYFRIGISTIGGSDRIAP